MKYQNHGPKHWMLTLIAAMCVLMGAMSVTAHAEIIVAANTPAADGSGFNNLVDSLRKNPVTEQDLLARPNEAPKPIAVITPPTRTRAKALRQASAHARLAARATHPNSGSSTGLDADELTVTPYTDSFFSSKVSPY